MPLVIAGATSGSTTVQATDAVTATITLPSATDTLVGKATTDTLTNKTLTLPVVGTTIGVGGATPSASGAGITFPATQSASTNANTLDDYEEGTWTPSIGGTSTYTVQVGKYTKIGNVVTAYFYMTILLKGTGSSYGLTSLPFVGSSVGGQPQFGLMGNFSNVAQNVYWMYYYNDTGTTNLNIGGSTSLSTGAAVPIAQMQNATSISGSITYFTN
jgi:hypothetical protein